MLSQSTLVDVAAIRVEREARQRQSNVDDFDDLKSSLKRWGILNPIIITNERLLVAGERRLRAAQAIGMVQVPCRFVDTLSTAELMCIELEENLKRKDLDWRDEVRAIVRLHEHHSTVDGWTQERTAASIGVDNTYISHCIRVGRELDSPRLATATGLRAALNMIQRRDERAMDDAFSSIIEAGDSIFGKASDAGQNAAPAPSAQTGDGADQGATQTSAPPPSPPPSPILNENFILWAPQYSGPRFNLLHCDFPYGINVFGGQQANTSGRADTYADDPDLYWALLKCLCENIDRLLTPSAHMLFWFPMEYYTETLEYFDKHSDIVVQKYPLVWTKSDNLGLLPDPKRGPRRIYETALLGSRGDRLIVRAVSNAYHAPTDKALHPSAKPEPVLKHFFQMFLDEQTKLLDPTCGGGSAIRAADAMGAATVVGLEIDPEICAGAQSALRAARNLRKATK